MVAIGAGGMLGAWARFRLAAFVYQRTGFAFPWGTLAVNLVGSFLLGLLLPMLDRLDAQAPLRGFITVGVLSSFTTFSTFAFETVRLVEDGRRQRAVLYVCASIGLGLVSIATGLLLAAAVR